MLFLSCDLEGKQESHSKAGGFKYGTDSLIRQSSNSLYFTDFTMKNNKMQHRKNKSIMVHPSWEAGNCSPRPLVPIAAKGALYKRCAEWSWDSRVQFTEKPV